MAIVTVLEMAARWESANWLGSFSYGGLDCLVGPTSFVRQGPEGFDVRRIVAALAPTELEAGALAGALRRMLDRLAEETGVDTELHVDEGFPALPPAVEVALLRTAQSALANVRLHADAKRVVVNLADVEDAVRLDIADDGRGFDVTAWDTGANRVELGGYGLHSMRARLRELGGGLEVESAPEEGTALSAHVPFGGRTMDYR